MSEENKHPLDEIKFGVMAMGNYRGVIVVKQPNGLYRLWKYKDLTAEGVDAIIEKTNEWLGKSVKQ